jgi:hypothetical protein
VTNRHFALENFERQWLRGIYSAPNAADVAAEALRDTRLDRLAYADDWPREVVSLQASEAADSIDAALVASLQPRYTSDPKYVFGVTGSGVDTHADLGASAPASREALKRAIVPLLGSVGQLARVRAQPAALGPVNALGRLAPPELRCRWPCSCSVRPDGSRRRRPRPTPSAAADLPRSRIS